MTTQNKISKLQEFKEVLSSYRMSESSIRTLKSTNLVLLVAPTSAGRNTIIRELKKTGEYYFVISDTTRLPRLNDGIMEKNGIDYWFRSEDEMLEDLKEGKFLEAALIHDQQVSGISIRELEKANSQDKIAITDIEIVGVDSIMGAKSDAHPIFVLPPGFEEWQKRLKHRGEMSDEEKTKRMRSAAKELKHALEHDYYSFVINEDVQSAAQQIHQIARYGTVNYEGQEEARQLAEQLLLATNSFLANK